MGDMDTLMSKLMASYPVNKDFKDASGNGYDATAEGALIDTGRKHIGEGAASLDGVDDRIQIGIPPVAARYISTISLWGLLESGAPHDTRFWGHPAGYGPTNDGSGIPSILSGNRLQIAIGIYGYTIADLDDYGFTRDAWHHYIFEFAKNTPCRVWFDGQYIGQTSANCNSIYFRNAWMFLGDQFLDTYGYHWLGGFDAPLIFDAILDADEKALLWNDGKGLELPADLIVPARRNEFVIDTTRRDFSLDIGRREYMLDTSRRELELDTARRDFTLDTRRRDLTNA